MDKEKNAESLVGNAIKLRRIVKNPWKERKRWVLFLYQKEEHINALYDLCNNRYIDVLVQPGGKENEFSAICEMVDRYHGQDKTIFMADPGYERFNVFAHIEQKNMFCLIRVKDKGSNGILSGIKTSKCPTYVNDLCIYRSKRPHNRRFCSAGRRRK